MMKGCNKRGETFFDLEGNPYPKIYSCSEAAVEAIARGEGISYEMAYKIAVNRYGSEQMYKRRKYV